MDLNLNAVTVSCAEKVLVVVAVVLLVSTKVDTVVSLVVSRIVVVEVALLKTVSVVPNCRVIVVVLVFGADDMTAGLIPQHKHATAYSCGFRQSDAYLGFELTTTILSRVSSRAASVCNGVYPSIVRFEKITMPVVLV